MRFTSAALVVAVALSSAACASAQPVQMPVYTSAPAMFRLAEFPTVPPPANDIPESERRAWIEANRPQVAYVPAQDQHAEDEYSSCHDCGHGWGIGLPISIGLGYYGGGCHGGGFGVGVNVLGLGVGVGFGGW